LRRIIPLRLVDAQFGTWRERVAYAEHWEAEFKAMEEKFRHLAESDFRLYKAMQEWHNRIGDLLAYVNDAKALNRCPKSSNDGNGDSCDRISGNALNYALAVAWFPKVPRSG
jgi:hypothetical protein